MEELLTSIRSVEMRIGFTRIPADGNYNVTVELGSAQAASTTQIEAELARIVVPTVKLAADVFSVNVHNETQRRLHSA